MTDPPRFICDVMLGSLARWLRLLGFDTAYFRTIDDNDLVRIARQQGRLLLTRDTGIAKRKGPQKTVLIHSNDTFGQLKEVLSYELLPCIDPPLHLNPPLHPSQEGTTKKASLGLFMRSPRCPLCNGELAAADKDAVAGRIPEYVFLNAESFLTCTECCKVYWHGSHKKSIDSQLQKIIGSLL